MAYDIITGAEPWSATGSGGRASVGVVITHGFLANPVDTRPYGEALAGAGFSVEVLRLPGHGTHWRELARTRYADWRGEVDRAVDRLLARCAQVVLAGHSMGGTLSLDVAARRRRVGRGDAIAGVIAMNPLIVDRTDPLGRLAPLLQHVAPFVPASLAGVPNNDIKRGGDEQAYAVIPAKAGYSLTRELPGLRERVQALDVPVLLIGSREDHVTPPANWRWLADHLPDVEVVVAEDSYHVITLDNDAELAAQRSIAFIDRVTGTT